ncbi:hypothetical protein ccbrp13_66730 [Ktedonobacteria bacterium brp13]|nr:hypothetical protein ccbrp13_66730 [Ktedonobacteria bacterium brp13]
MNTQSSHKGLLEAGLTEQQIERLGKVRKHYVENEQMRIVAETHRLCFARWLVHTGRLTDSIA